MTESNSELQYDFYSQRTLVVRFSELELSSDAGILLAGQAEEQVQVCQGLVECINEWRDPNMHYAQPQTISKSTGISISRGVRRYQ